MLRTGIYPACVTPRRADGAPDAVGLARLLAWFESAGCAGAVIAGTTGEGMSLSAPQKRDLLKELMPARGKLELILGIATTSVDEARWLAGQATKIGAAASLLMAPTNAQNATEEGLYRWFEAVLQGMREQSILIYNFPQKTGVTLSPELIGRLAELPAFAGIKDSSGREQNLTEFQVGSNHVRFVGDETLLRKAHEAGWSGSISGASNSVAPWLCSVWEEGFASARWEVLLPVIRALRSLPQPANHKAVLRAMGILESDEVWPPLLAAEPEDRDRALAALASLGIRPAED